MATSEHDSTAPRRDSARIDPLIGQRLASYEILGRVARGGMGVVYRARHVYIDKIVALKVLDPALARRTELIERFRTEAQSLARVEHENVVKVIDILEDRGVHFIVMDFAEGVNLRQFVREHGPLRPDELLSVMRQTAQALFAAHREGILHRDIKPENLIRNARGRCKLADFGLAGDLRLIAEGHEGPITFGTPAYSSPEVLRRIVPDKRSDIFSFGATMYHLAAGEPPFGKSGAQQVMLRQQQGAPDLAARRPDLPEKLARVITDCLALHPKDRPDSFAEILQRLPRRAHARAGTTTAPTEPTDLLATATTPLPATGRTRALGLGAIVLALAVVAVILWLVWPRGTGPTEPEPPVVGQPHEAPTPVIQPQPTVQPPQPVFQPEDVAFAGAEIASRAAMSNADYVAAWRALEDFRKRFPNSEHLESAASHQRDVVARVAALRESNLRKSLEASNEALNERRTADALAALDRFPPELLLPLHPADAVEVSLRLETQRQRILAAEAADLTALLEQADTLRKEWRDNFEKSDTEESIRLRVAANLLRERDALEAFLPGRTAATHEQVGKRLSGLRRQIETAHQQGVQPAAAWRAFVNTTRVEMTVAALAAIQAVPALTEARDFEAARARIDETLRRLAAARVQAAEAAPAEVAARIREGSEVETQLRRFRDDVALAERNALAVHAALRRNRLGAVTMEYRVHLPGDPARTERHVGRVISLAQTEFELDTDTGRVKLKIDLLSNDTIRALVRTSRSFDEQLALVAWLLAMGRADLAAVEAARIERTPDAPADVIARLSEFTAHGRLGAAAIRRLEYLAAIGGRYSNFAERWPGESLEGALLAAQTTDPAAYLALVREVSEPELVHLEALARALDGLPAVPDLRLRVALEPWDAAARLALARGLARTGDVTGARTEAGRALLIDPGHEAAYALLKELT